MKGAVVVMSFVVSLAASVLAIAQDTGPVKYNVRVPNGLEFSEFKGYESWQTVAVSHSEKLIAVILANPE